MPYSVPPRWNHGDTNVSAARMNIYSDDLNALYALLEPFHRAAYPVPSTATAVIAHRWRWLWYQTTTGGYTSSIKDPSGVSPDVTLPSNEGSLAVFDLADVAWLTPGQFYNVTGVAFAIEDWEP